MEKDNFVYVVFNYRYPHSNGETDFVLGVCDSLIEADKMIIEHLNYMAEDSCSDPKLHECKKEVWEGHSIEYYCDDHSIHGNAILYRTSRKRVNSRIY